MGTLLDFSVLLQNGLKCVVFLGGINIAIIAVVIIHRTYKALTTEYETKKKEQLWPRVESYLKAASNARHLPTMEMRNSERDLVYDVLLSYSEYYDMDIHEIFDINGFTRDRIENLWTRKNAQLLEELAVLRSPNAQDLLFARLAETTGEEAYRVAYALASIRMNEINSKRLVKTLLKSVINVERSSQLVAMAGLPLEALLEILYEQDTPAGEKIMLNAIGLSCRIDEDWIIEDIRPYLFHSREVAVAAVRLLGKSSMPYALELLRTEYYANPSWEVRVNIANQMSNFPAYMSIPVLKEMVFDESTWVQFHALSSLASMGQEGMDAIVDVAMEDASPAAVGFARQMLALSEERRYHDYPVRTVKEAPPKDVQTVGSPVMADETTSGPTEAGLRESNYAAKPIMSSEDRDSSEILWIPESAESAGKVDEDLGHTDEQDRGSGPYPVADEGSPKDSPPIDHKEQGGDSHRSARGAGADPQISPDPSSPDDQISEDEKHE